MDQQAVPHTDRLTSSDGKAVKVDPDNRLDRLLAKEESLLRVLKTLRTRCEGFWIIQKEYANLESWAPTREHDEKRRKSLMADKQRLMITQYGQLRDARSQIDGDRKQASQLRSELYLPANKELETEMFWGFNSELAMLDKIQEIDANAADDDFRATIRDKLEKAAGEAELEDYEAMLISLAAIGPRVVVYQSAALNALKKRLNAQILNLSELRERLRDHERPHRRSSTSEGPTA